MANDWVEKVLFGKRNADVGGMRQLGIFGRNEVGIGGSLNNESDGWTGADVVSGLKPGGGGIGQVVDGRFERDAVVGGRTVVVTVVGGKTYVVRVSDEKARALVDDRADVGTALETMGSKTDVDGKTVVDTVIDGGK